MHREVFMSDNIQPKQQTQPARGGSPAGPSPDFVRLTEQALAEDDAYLAALDPPPGQTPQSPTPEEAESTPTPTPAQKALNLRYLGPAAYLHGAMRSVVGSAFDVDDFEQYLRDFLEDAGGATDPVERMLLEQLAWSHNILGTLHIRAAHAHGVEATKVYQAASARLMAEFRRTALALTVYRQPAPGKRAAPTPVRDTKSPTGPAVASNGSTRLESITHLNPALQPVDTFT
jgi:hypothetical protein